MGADVMMGNDPDCARWIRRFRDVPPPSTGAPGEQRGRREVGSRRRPTGA
jgi:5-methyltetrahydrofolate--homocysteine methyltransferase